MTKVVGIGGLLAERQRTHGSFEENANFAQQVKDLMRGFSGWEKCSDVQRESLDLIALKISRVLSGDPDFIDHWRDLAGYPNLVVRALEVATKAAE